MTLAYLGAFKKARKATGRIINVSSNSSWAYFGGLSSYATSKVAINTCSEYVGKESVKNKKSSIRCVAMHPGVVARTHLSDNMEMPETIKGRIIDKPALAGRTAVYLTTDRSNFLMGRFVTYLQRGTWRSWRICVIV